MLCSSGSMCRKRSLTRAASEERERRYFPSPPVWTGRDLRNCFSSQGEALPAPGARIACLLSYRPLLLSYRKGLPGCHHQSSSHLELRKAPATKDKNGQEGRPHHRRVPYAEETGLGEPHSLSRSRGASGSGPQKGEAHRSGNETQGQHEKDTLRHLPRARTPHRRFCKIDPSAPCPLPLC